MASQVEIVADRLSKAKQDLLDLTLRNRLLNTSRRSNSSSIEIRGERSTEVFRTLVTDKRSMSFLARPESTKGDEAESEGADEEQLSLFQPDESLEVASERHSDDRLQTGLASDTLQRRLLRLFYDARTYEEEQGVNILYLAIGFLKWFEGDNSDDARFAPLVLVPVELSRSNASSRFKLKGRDEDVATNLSLQAKLLEFGIKLPDVPESEEFSPAEYFESVRRAIGEKNRWEVLADDIVLWFFSFSKFLMYRDLDPKNWPNETSLEKHRLISGLLDGGFRPTEPFCSESDFLDTLLQPLDLTHVVDADSSQTIAIEDVRRGRDLVIQGPPGTGKSQTIANIIATAVKEGKTVLFVAEKMAALEVVKRRLETIGLGDICLELHSHKANKRLVLQELQKTLKLGPPKRQETGSQAQALGRLRDRLNRYCDDLHTEIDRSKLTPYAIMGDLCRLQASGIVPRDFSFNQPATWSAEDVREKLQTLREVTAYVANMGVPQQSIWHGVKLEGWVPTNTVRTQETLLALVRRLGVIIRAAEELATALKQETPRTAFDVSNLARLAHALLKAPAMDPQAIADRVWSENRDTITELLEVGHTAENAQATLEPVLAPGTWSTDVGNARRIIAGHGRSWLRFLNRRYREAVAILRGILKSDPPKEYSERVAILDTLITWQDGRRRLEQPDQADVGRRAFGSLWRGAASDWTALRAIERWETECRGNKIPTDFRQVVGELKDRHNVEGYVREIGGDLKKLLTELRELLERLSVNLTAAFGQNDVANCSLKQLAERLEAWRANFESLTKWIAFRRRFSALRAAGLGFLPEQIYDGRVSHDAAVDYFHLAYFESVIEKVLQERAALAEFEGQSHSQLRDRYQAEDRRRIELSRFEVVSKHFQEIPKGGSSLGHLGQLGVLQHEIQKRRNHKPVRRLIKEAGDAVQKIKPVFMMSPMSIAQFLEPGAVKFDLLVFDEASQVRPEDALGAVARADQIVVVGDEKQLPPTRFFSALDGAPPKEDDDDQLNVSDLDSILGLCKSRQMPERMLRWHYRSRHQSLIAVSNHQFYDNKLFVVPSPLRGAGQGLTFRHVPDGVFDRGHSATNRIEARAVAEAVMRHARECPHLSLGVGAFSVSQRDAILDELELLRRNSKETEEFFLAGGAEPFFVKNLENIQGDEREVILISVGYARDKSGFLSMHFGPLSNKGGERRLNVLISRARTRCEVFSSITADDIDLGRTTAVGAHAFKAFLRYAETGYLDAGAPTENGVESEFERQVAKAVGAHGYRVESQIGVAGFFVDLAVIDPDKPGRYMLGIECDGAQYHSSRSARDRDRLRQQVLEDRGWIIHRIWSTDWFNRPAEQLTKVTAAIEAAREELARRDAVAAAAQKREEELRKERAEIERHAREEVDPTTPYIEADFAIGGGTAIPDMPLRTLMGLAIKVVEIEGPIHADEVARRLASLCGASRAGSKINLAVSTALQEAADKKTIAIEDRFCRMSAMDAAPIRNREEVKSAGLKRPEMLPPAEVQKAVWVLVNGHLGVAQEDAVVAVARMLGFKSTGSALRERIMEQVEKMVGIGTIDRKGDSLHLPESDSGMVIPFSKTTAVS